MSYFHGIPIPNFNSEKRSRRKHSKTKVENEDELEPAHGIRHRRMHNTSKSLKKLKSGLKKEVDNTCEDDKATIGTRNKEKRHFHKEIERLKEENRLVTAKLEDTGESEANDTKEKHQLLAKIRIKYHKLEEKYEELCEENKKLSIILQEKDKEYRELHAHHEKLTQSLQINEQDQSNLVIISEKIKSDNTQLKNDISLLKNLVYRLNVELERYQDKLRNSSQSIEFKNSSNSILNADSEAEIKKAINSWGKVNSHALAPLLDAYQENLEEKEQLIQKYEKEIDIFSGKCKEVVRENESLFKEVEELKSKCERYVFEMKTIEEDAGVIKEQNDLLTKQTNMQKQKLQEIHSVYEHKVETMSQDNNKLHKEYLTCKAELSNLQGKYEILNEGYEKLKNNSEKTMPVSVHNASVEECKRLFEELKFQYENDKKKLTSKIKLLEESQPENEKQLILITAERDQLKTQLKSLEKTYKRTQQKLDHLQKSVCSIQISRESMKRQLNKTTEFCKELVAEQEKILIEKDKLVASLKEREKENENIQYLRNNITHRMGTLRSQLKIVQKGAKEQLETVEKHIKNKELDADQMKAEYSRELNRLKNLVKDKEEIIGKLQREKSAMQDNLEYVLKAASSDGKKLKEALKNSKIYTV